MNKDYKNKPSICFILLPGFSPDNVPVLNLKKHLEKRGHTAIASNFYGKKRISNFSVLTVDECQNNLCQVIQEAKDRHDKIVGIGVSLGGALLLDHAKNKKNLDAIVSIGTPFKVKNIKLINAAEKFLPIIKPFWKIIDQRERRLPPIAATKMVMNYLCYKFPENLEKITTPTLFIHSKKDKITDYKILEEYTEKISSPIKEITFFDNGGHVINGGTEKVLDLVFDFLGSI